MSSLLDIEISMHDWESVPCACGKRPVSHVVDRFRLLLEVESIDQYDHYFDGHLYTPSVTHEGAVPAVSVVLAALAIDLAPIVRLNFMNLLLTLLSPDGQSFGAEEQGRDLIDECHAAARRGIWLLYSIMFSDPSPGVRGCAYGALRIVERDRSRIDYIASQARDLLPDWANSLEW